MSCAFNNTKYHRGQNYITKNSLQRSILEAINFVIITKTLCVQLKQTRERPQKYYKTNLVSGNYFVIISARMVMISYSMVKIQGP